MPFSNCIICLIYNNIRITVYLQNLTEIPFDSLYF